MGAISIQITTGGLSQYCQDGTSFSTSQIPIGGQTHESSAKCSENCAMNVSISLCLCMDYICLDSLKTANIASGRTSQGRFTDRPWVFFEFCVIYMYIGENIYTVKKLKLHYTTVKAGRVLLDISCGNTRP